MVPSTGRTFEDAKLRQSNPAAFEALTGSLDQAAPEPATPAYRSELNEAKQGRSRHLLQNAFEQEMARQRARYAYDRQLPRSHSHPRYLDDELVMMVAAAAALGSVIFSF